MGERDGCYYEQCPSRNRGPAALSLGVWQTIGTPNSVVGTYEGRTHWGGGWGTASTDKFCRGSRGKRVTYKFVPIPSLLFFKRVYSQVAVILPLKDPFL